MNPNWMVTVEIKMNTFIDEIKATDLFGKKNISWKLKSVNVLVGKNGSGKSTILRSINSLLKKDTNEDLKKSRIFNILLNNGTSIKHTVNELNSDTDKLIASLSELSKSIKKTQSNTKQKSKIDRLIKDVLENKSNVRNIKISAIESSDDNDDEVINSELISTVNMNANSVMALIGSDGESKTILDMEISAESKKLKDIFNNSRESYLEIKERLESVLNKLFSESRKSIKINNGEIIIQWIDNNEHLTIPNLSSGERQLIYIMLKAANTSLENTILLMDEPEISLHLSWQEKLIDSITQINPNCQLIIVTHSPAILMKGWMDSFVDIKNIETMADK